MRGNERKREIFKQHWIAKQLQTKSTQRQYQILRLTVISQLFRGTLSIISLNTVMSFV